MGTMGWLSYRHLSVVVLLLGGSSAVNGLDVAVPTDAAGIAGLSESDSLISSSKVSADGRSYGPKPTKKPTKKPPPTKRPNIVVFLADDLGRTDVGFTEGNLQTPTPNIDKFAWDGVILNRHYSQPVCTPTRAAFLTGKYPFHIGMQSNPISEGEPWGLPLEFPIQPELFKTLGYQTWLVGKWHLGSYQRSYYPGNRGFDYSFGITAGDSNWFNYTAGWITPIPTSGKCLRENGKAIFSNITNNDYLPNLLNDKVEQLIHNADTTKPFYLYFPTPVPHTADEPYTAVLHTMPEFQLRPVVAQFPDKFPDRKKQLGLIQVLDESFRRLTDALTYKGVINDTIIIFLADNGAPNVETAAFVHGANHGSNWPLRMGKGTYFEGGIRTPAFIWSPLLKRRGRLTNHLFHLTDWWPTLWEAVGGDPAALPAGGDGVSHWPYLQGWHKDEPREEIVININNAAENYGIIYRHESGVLYKLIGGAVFDNAFLGWNQVEGTDPDDDSWKVYSPAQVNCNNPQGQEVTPCDPAVADCLFDILNDPCETNNLADSYPVMVELLQKKIRRHNITTYPAVIKPFDARSLPDLWDGWWVPWLDPTEIYDTVPLTFQPFNPSSAF